MKDLQTIKWIFGKVKSQKINFILLNMINIVYSVLSVYLILISKQIIDSAEQGAVLELKKYVMRLILLAITQIALKSILASISAVTRAKLEVNFKQNVLSTILSRNYEKISSFHGGDLMTRIVSDVNIIIETLVTLLPNIVSMMTRLVCAVWLLFQISKEFAVILLIGGIILFVVVNIFKPYLKNIHKKVQEASANVSLFCKEVFENLLVIKIFEAEDTILEKSRQLQNAKYDIQMKRRALSIASGTGFNAIFQVSYLYALIWSAYNLYKKNISVGGLTSIVQLITQIQSPIIGLSRSFQNVFGMLASAERIIELGKIPKDQVSRELDVEKLYHYLDKIVVCDVDFTYDNKHVLDKVNFEIKKGEIVAIYGESGVGKSTLLKLILGIIKKKSGEIYFELSNGYKQEIGVNTRGMFTYVPQGKFILSGTIRENIVFVNENTSEEDINQALEISGCMEFINKLENGLDTVIGERGSGLSEGQLQRLSLARAIVSKAPILILDEVTSSLDSKTEEEVLRNIKNLHDRTCIIVTHREESISKICDKEFVLKNMKIYEKENGNGRS